MIWHYPTPDPSFHSITTLIMLLFLRMQYAVLSSRWQFCTLAVCEPPIHRKKKPFVPLVHVYCSSVSLKESREHPCTMESSLLSCMNTMDACFLFGLRRGSWVRMVASRPYPDRDTIYIFIWVTGSGYCKAEARLPSANLEPIPSLWLMPTCSSSAAGSGPMLLVPQFLYPLLLVTGHYKKHYESLK